MFTKEPIKQSDFCRYFNSHPSRLYWGVMVLHTFVPSLIKFVVKGLKLELETNWFSELLNSQEFKNLFSEEVDDNCRKAMEDLIRAIELKREKAERIHSLNLNLELEDFILITKGPFKGERGKVISIGIDCDDLEVTLIDQPIPMSLSLRFDSIQKL